MHSLFTIHLFFSISSQSLRGQDHGRQWGASFLGELPQNVLEGVDLRAPPLTPAKHTGLGRLLSAGLYPSAGPSPLCSFWVPRAEALGASVGVKGGSRDGLGRGWAGVGWPLFIY